MTKMRGIFRRLAELAAVALVAVLIVITFLTLQRQFAAGPAPTGWPAGTQPYPGPAPTDAYPGPVATLPPMAMTLGGPTAVVLTPGQVLEMSTEMPLPSGTPRPTVTRRPGPTATAFPRATLPPDASGTILYLVNDQASIWAISVDGLGVGAGDGTPIPLSLDTTPDAVVPSPDGRYWLVKLLLFQGYQLYIVDTQQRQTWPLFRDETSGDPPMWFHGWHPDSRQVLVSRDGDALLLVNVETGEATTLAYILGFPYGAAISPDGRTVVYVDWWQYTPRLSVWRVSTAGSDARALFDIAGGEVISWSPDGARVLFTGGPGTNAQGTPLAPAGSGSLWLMDPDGGYQRPLDIPYVGGEGRALAWSPQGEWLAFTGQGAEGDGSAVYVANVNTGEVRRLAAGYVPVWAPDGSRLAFLSDQSGAPEVWTVTLAGAELRQLTANGLPKNSTLAWSR